MMSGKMNSKFLRYYSWLECAHGAESNVADNTTTSLFPCFFPYPAVFTLVVLVASRSMVAFGRRGI